MKKNMIVTADKVIHFNNNLKKEIDTIDLNLQQTINFNVLFKDQIEKIEKLIQKKQCQTDCLGEYKKELHGYEKSIAPRLKTHQKQVSKLNEKLVKLQTLEEKLQKQLNTPLKADGYHALKETQTMLNQTKETAQAQIGSLEDLANECEGLQGRIQQAVHSLEEMELPIQIDRIANLSLELSKSLNQLEKVFEQPSAPPTAEHKQSLMYLSDALHKLEDHTLKIDGLSKHRPPT